MHILQKRNDLFKNDKISKLIEQKYFFLLILKKIKFFYIDSTHVILKS